MALTIFPRLNAYFPKDDASYKFYLGEDNFDFAYTVTNDTADRRSFLSLYQGVTEEGIAIIYWEQQTGKLVIAARLRHLGQLTRTHVFLYTSQQTRGYAFSMKVGQPGHQHVEQFEWRSTRGSEVRGLHPRAYGWKLVRVGRKSGDGGGREVRATGESSDGKEIVAVWGTTRSSFLGWLLLRKKAFMFQLRGSGETGELGPKFHVFALMTALQIYSMTERFVLGWGLDNTVVAF
ncbi:hypothetical protein GGR53DRAFT_532337 [Hypoxylon sp. FL1150]|nr:hypothetical protein GGR53DRAFT_532337 [Hypoxylon sp. FL1150]